MMFIMGLRSPKSAILNIWGAANWNPNQKGLFYVLLALRGPERHHWGSQSRVHWAASSTAFPWAASETRPKSGATGAPMSERSPDALFRACGGLNPIIRSLCWMKLTRWAVIFGGTRLPHFWKCWILNRIFLSAIIIWMCLL